MWEQPTREKPQPHHHRRCRLRKKVIEEVRKIATEEKARVAMEGRSRNNKETHQCATTVTAAATEATVATVAGKAKEVLEKVKTAGVRAAVTGTEFQLQ